MKTLFVILSLLLVMPVYAETVVERQTTTVQQYPQPVTTTTTSQTTTTRPVVVAPGTTVTTTTTVTEAPIREGMLLNQVYELMGPPTYTKVFRKFNSRVVGYYDQRLTYQQPAGETLLFIEDSRVADIQYVQYRNIQQGRTTTTTVEKTQYR